MEDYLAFRKMITPIIIQALFWIGAVAIALYALWLIFSGATSRIGGGSQVLGGLILFFLGPLIVRISCEILILFFRINQTLADIRNALKNQG